MTFITKPDFSNNRQVKQFQLTSTRLSGTTVFGIEDILIPLNFTGNTINIDALQNIRTRGIILPNSLPQFTGATYQLLGRDNSTGKVVEVTGITGGTGTPISLTTIGTSGVSTLLGNVLNIPNYTTSGGTGFNTDDYVINGNILGNTLTLNRLSGGTVSISGLTKPSGLERLNEVGSKFGWRLIGRNPLEYGNVGDNAIDFGVNNSNNSTKGAIGDFTFNHGEDNSLTGYGSVGFGALITSSGSDSFSAGINITEAGYTNTIFGIGHSVKTMNCTVIGQAANVINQQISDFNFTKNKELFVVGNGTIANLDPDFTVLTRSNALVVKMDGEITAPSTTSRITAGPPRHLVTKEWIQSSYPPGSIDYVNEVSLSGTSLIFTGIGSGFTGNVDLVGLSAVPIEELATTQIINIGNIGAGPIEDGFNAFTFTGTDDPVQNQSEGYVLINSILNGSPTQHLFVGLGGSYGPTGSAIPAIDEDFTLINSTLLVDDVWRNASGTQKAYTYTETVKHGGRVHANSYMVDDANQGGIIMNRKFGNLLIQGYTDLILRGSNPNNSRVSVTSNGAIGAYDADRYRYNLFCGRNYGSTVAYLSSARKTLVGVAIMDTVKMTTAINTARMDYVALLIRPNLLAGNEADKITSILSESGRAVFNNGDFIIGNLAAPIGKVHMVTVDDTGLLSQEPIPENLSNPIIYTFASLPTGVTGRIARISDASGISYRGIASGGGSDIALVMYDGTNWIYH